MVHNAAWRRSLLCVLVLSLGFASPPCKARIYTNHWAVRIAGGPEVAEQIAQKYGYRNMGQVSHGCCQKLLLVCVHLSFTGLDFRPDLSPRTFSSVAQQGQRPWSRMAQQVPLSGLPLSHWGHRELSASHSQLSPGFGCLTRAVWVT